MADVFGNKPEAKAENGESKNGYVSHKREGKLLAVTLNTDKIRESESGKVFTVFVSFVENGHRVWGNLNISK